MNRVVLHQMLPILCWICHVVAYCIATHCLLHYRTPRGCPHLHHTYGIPTSHFPSTIVPIYPSWLPGHYAAHALLLCIATPPPRRYTWFAATRTGWRSPKGLMMLVTALQLLQMVAGCGIVLLALADDPACTWGAADPVGSSCALVMYASYFVLFAKLFFDNYFVKKSKKKE